VNLVTELLGLVVKNIRHWRSDQICRTVCVQDQLRNSIVWQRRLNDTTNTTTNINTTRAITTTTTTTTATRLHCAPASCPARYATAPPRRMMWPLS